MISSLPLAAGGHVHLVELGDALVDDGLQDLLRGAESLDVVLAGFQPSLEVAAGFRGQYSLAFGVDDLLEFGFVDLAERRGLLDDVGHTLPRVDVEEALRLALIGQDRRHGRRGHVLAQLISARV